MTPTSPLISIVIPAYKPPERLLILLEQLQGFHEKLPFVIIVVNDGSGSSYDPLFKKIIESKQAIVLQHTQNRGKGSALKTAFKYWLTHYANSQVGLVTADADGQHSAEDIAKLATALSQEPHALHLGVRTFQNKNIPWRSRFGNQLTKNIYRLISHADIQDTQTGLRALNRTLIEAMCEEKSNGYEFELAMLLKASQQQIPIHQHAIHTIYIERNKTSHFHPVYDAIKIYWILLKHFLQNCCNFTPTK